MTTDARRAAIIELHNCYISETGHMVPLMTAERRLNEFLNVGFTKEDLQLIIRHIKTVNFKSTFQISLRFDKIVGDIERAGDFLGEAKKHAAQQARTKAANYSVPKQEVLRQSGRDAQKPLGPCRAMSDVIRAMREEAQ